ncbi:MAG: hypothetical protein R3338_15770 [Thermoanaerobaculia bacterium]|nr:hypothetical protein [Thermoanaerobaculia bacterium]
MDLKVVIAAVAWTVVCGAMFLLVEQLNRPDPSEGFGHAEAGTFALETLRRETPQKYGDYIVINTARSDVASPNGAERWVVLCNRSNGDSRSSVIVELGRDGSELLGFRRPGTERLEPVLP